MWARFIGWRKGLAQPWGWAVLRMIFVRDRGPEDGENAVPGRLHDITALSVDGFDHQLECGIDNGSRLLRVQVLHDELHRALDIGEQRRDHLALAIKIFRRRYLSHINLALPTFSGRGCRRTCSERCPAFAVKPLAWRIVGAAFRAPIRQQCTAISAEFFAGRIFAAALCADHGTLVSIGSVIRVDIVTTFSYKWSMTPLRISEARKRLSQLVERVARGGAPVAIGRYGRERALLVSAEEYERLKTSVRRAKPPQTLEGTLTLECSPEDLIAESRRLGDFWLASVDKTEQKRRSPSK